MSGVDISSLKARSEKRRLLTLTTRNGWRFELRRPSDMELRDALGTPAARTSPAQFQAGQVYAALRGWHGPTIGDVDPEADAAVAQLPLPHDAQLYDALFGDRPELLDDIGAQLLNGYVERMKQREDASKNSQSSSGSAPS